MKGQHKKKFYASVGQQLTAAAKKHKLDIPMIVRKSGEQHITVQRILQGEPCTLLTFTHVAVAVGANVSEIINNATTEGKQHEDAEESKVDELI